MTLRLWMRPAGRALGTLALAVLALSFLLAGPVGAQTPAATGLREMRNFWHVFIAYAIAWVLIFGWLISILKRLRAVEEKLEK